MENKTKYYKQEPMGKLEEVDLNRNNWWYVQLDASIRTVFKKFKTELPKYVIVEMYSTQTYIYIFRQDVNDIESANKWKVNKVFIQEELDIQAEVNSHDEYDSENSMNYQIRLV